ncbi:hypothetical protein CJ195_07855 [Bacillus sp. UMB0899]|uniref:hypothetical protein n=1 Tax=Metabacillus schmidteae TaxID=2730405 RepID=UPI000C80202D|nr:hypothetical protein [Metabacillus schmidteae]PMC38373.1 hypothetical protein CJ195_07855 [Bacillus sp. UMB0899]
MWMFVIDIMIVIVSFYFFSIFTAHIFMYKPDPDILFQLKSMGSSFLFAVIGILLLRLLAKLKTPEKWRSLIYLVIFLSGAVGTFAYLTSTIFGLI